MKALKAERTNEMPAKLICLNNWLSGIGVTSTTGWRWRKKGILPTVNIYGRLYVTAETAANFVSRATAGEFAQDVRPGGSKTTRANKLASH